MALLTDKCSSSPTLQYTWNLQRELDELPDSEGKALIIEWQARQVVTPGPQSLTSLFYRSRLQWLLENLEILTLSTELREYLDS